MITESFQEFVGLSVKMRIFTWQDVAKFVSQSTIQNLEIFAAYPGQVEYQTFGSFDNNYSAKPIN